MDFVLFDHQLLLNRSNDIDYKEGIIKSTISLMNFLKKNDLLIDIDPFNEDGSIKENIVIRKSNVTDEGFQLFVKPVNNWWNALDRGDSSRESYYFGEWIEKNSYCEKVILYFQKASISLLRPSERHCSRRTILWKLKIEMTF